MSKKCNLKDLVLNFKFEGKFIVYEDHKRGHINDTYILDFKREDDSIRKYILQRINSDIFKNPEELMDNFKKVTNHIVEKIVEAKGNPLRETLNIVPTKDNKTFYKTADGDYFRALVFIEGARTYMMVEKPEHLYTTGKTLGKFQKQLSDFSVEDLYETIPDFHNTKKRYEAFIDSVEKDEKGRVSSCLEDIAFAMNRAKDTEILINMLEEGRLPLRVTHNDTKFNNVMIDDITGEGIALIDLDTVMPGLSLYDFGDAIRSSATTALEDEADLSKVNFDINLFEYFTRGYLETAKDALTETEIEYLPFSAKLITLELGIRFLMDHLNGDIYFKVDRENHNLDRARNQFKLVADMEKNMDSMRMVVQKYI